MIFAKLDYSLLKIPEVQQSGFQSRCIDAGQPPDSELSMRYGDELDAEEAGRRLRTFLQRTGRQIYNNVLLRKEEPERYPDDCKVCHEVGGSGCVIPVRCPASLGNPLCVHTDNATVYPGVECLLRMLTIGQQISRENFLQHRAWLRIVASRFTQLDLLSRKNDVKESEFELLFGEMPTEQDRTHDTHSRLERNGRWQAKISQRVLPYVEYIQRRIRDCMRQEAHLEKFFLDRPDYNKVEELMRQFRSEFWTMKIPE